MQYYCQLHSLQYTQVCLQHDCTRKGPLCDMCIDTHDQHLTKNLETYINDQYKALQIDHQMNILQKLGTMKTYFHDKISQLLIDVNLIDEKRKRVIVNQLKTEKMSIVQFQSKIVELVQRDQLKEREYLEYFYQQLNVTENSIKEAFAKLPTRQIQPQSHPQSQSQSAIISKPSLSTDKDILSEIPSSSRSNKSKERIFQEKKLSVSPIRKQLMQRDLMPVGSFNNSKLKNYFTEQDSQQTQRSKQDTQNSFKITRPFEMDRSSERKFQFDGYQSKPQEKNTSFELFQPPQEHVQLENTHMSPMSIDTLYKSPVETKSYTMKSTSNKAPTSKSPQNKALASKSPQNQPQSVFQYIQQEQQSQSDLNYFVSPKNDSVSNPLISNPIININSLQQSEKEEKQQVVDFQIEKERNDQQKGFWGNTFATSEINRSPAQNPQTTPSQSLSVINDRSFADPSASIISSKSVVLPQVKITYNLPNPFQIEQIQTVKAHDKSIKDICVMDDDKLISGSRDCSIKMWDARTHQMKMALKEHTDQVLCIAFNKQKRILASGSADKTVRIWKPSPHWKIYRVCEGHFERIRCVGFVNQFIVSGADDTTLKVWDFEGELKHSHKTNGRVGALVSEKNFVILSSGKNIQIFDTQNMVKKIEKPAHKNLVLCLAFQANTTDKGILISGAKDNCVKLWEYPTLEELRCVTEDYPVQSVCFGQGPYFIFGLMGFEQEGKITIWKLAETLIKVQEITVNPYGCNKILYDYSCNMLYTAHENKRIEFIQIKLKSTDEQ